MTDATHHRWSDIPREEVTPMLDRRLITGERVMLAHVYLKKGCIVPKHQHVHEQLAYILSGALKFWIDGKEFSVLARRRMLECCMPASSRI